MLQRAAALLGGHSVALALAVVSLVPRLSLAAVGARHGHVGKPPGYVIRPAPCASHADCDPVDGSPGLCCADTPGPTRFAINGKAATCAQIGAYGGGCTHSQFGHEIRGICPVTCGQCRDPGCYPRASVHLNWKNSIQCSNFDEVESPMYLEVEYDCKAVVDAINAYFEPNPPLYCDEPYIRTDDCSSIDNINAALSNKMACDRGGGWVAYGTLGGGQFEHDEKFVEILRKMMSDSNNRLGEDVNWTTEHTLTLERCNAAKDEMFEKMGFNKGGKPLKFPAKMPLSGACRAPWS